MNDAKPWYLSLGMWSAVMTVVLSLLAAAGITIKASPDNLADAMVTIAPVVAAIVAGIAAAIGRYGAIAVLTPTKAAANRLQARMAAARVANPGQWP